MSKSARCATLAQQETARQAIRLLATVCLLLPFAVSARAQTCGGTERYDLQFVELKALDQRLLRRSRACK